jgi:ATP-dependent DNA helicase RecG
MNGPVEQLEALLADLRVVGSDHRSIEAKTARSDLPATISDTLSAFANTDGGVILLGVKESPGSFEVTGVEDPRHVTSALQAAAEQMEPPLRPAIDIVAHPSGIVVMAQVPPVPRDQRPCHRRSDGPHSSSFVRVGDGDHQLTDHEVAVMLANRAPVDTGRAPAPQGAVLDEEAVTKFVAAIRESSRRAADVDEQEILYRYGVVSSDRTELTLAGLLTLGQHPESFLDAARVSLRRQPTAEDPPGARHDAVKVEGTVGELLDGVLSGLGARLGHVQVERDGQILDELDVPRETLREVVSNALIHRSFADGAKDESVLVEITPEAVTVTSPGGLHVTADPRQLGLDPIAGVRNHTLVRISEHLRTPSGARVVEHQALGIARADRACHANGTMPALFVDLPTRFCVVMLRHSLAPAPARRILTDAGLAPTPAAVRIISVLLRLDDAKASASSELGPPIFDARLCARALAPCTLEDASSELKALETTGILRRSHLRRTPTWLLAVPTPPPSGTGTLPVTATVAAKTDRIDDLIQALADGPSEGLTPLEIQRSLGLASTNARYRWLHRATERGLIEPSSDRPYDRTKQFRLTAKGRAYASRLQRPGSQTR